MRGEPGRVASHLREHVGPPSVPSRLPFRSSTTPWSEGRWRVGPGVGDGRVRDRQDRRGNRHRAITGRRAAASREGADGARGRRRHQRMRAVATALRAGLCRPARSVSGRCAPTSSVARQACSPSRLCPERRRRGPPALRTRARCGRPTREHGNLGCRRGDVPMAAETPDSHQTCVFLRIPPERAVPACYRVSGPTPRQRPRRSAPAWPARRRSTACCPPRSTRSRTGATDRSDRGRCSGRPPRSGA